MVVKVHMVVQEVLLHLQVLLRLLLKVVMEFLLDLVEVVPEVECHSMILETEDMAEVVVVLHHVVVMLLAVVMVVPDI
jgi:hypothetical protein